MWEQACSRWRCVRQLCCRLDDRFREQARSHRGTWCLDVFLVNPGLQRLAVVMTANRHGAEFDAVFTRSRNLRFAALGFRFLRQIETCVDAVVAVAQVRGADFRSAQIDPTFSRSDPCAGQLRGAANLQIHTLCAADTRGLADAVLVRITAVGFQGRFVVSAAEFGIVGDFILLGWFCFCRGQAQVNVDLSAGLAVLTAFHGQITAHLAADGPGIDPRTGQMHIPGRVDDDAVSLDLTVLLRRAFQVINPNLGPGIEAVVTAGNVLFIHNNRCAVAQVAASIQRDIPVSAVLRGLGRFLIDPTLLRIKADARGADLGALQVDSLTAESDVALTVELATGQGLGVFVDPTDVEIAAQIAALISAFLSTGFTTTHLQTTAKVAARGAVRVGRRLQIEFAVSLQVDAACRINLRPLEDLIATTAQHHWAFALNTRDLSLAVLRLFAGVIELEAGAQINIGAVSAWRRADVQRAVAAQTGGVTALTVVGLIQRQLTAGLDRNPALPAIEMAAFKLTLFAQVDVHPVAAGIVASHRGGAVFARLAAAARTAAGNVHVFTGFGVDPHVSLGVQRLIGAAVGVARGARHQRVGADVHLARTRLVLGTLVLQGTGDLDVHGAALELADHGVAGLLGMAGILVTDSHVDADIRLTEIGQRVLVRHLAVQHVLDRPGDGSGDVFVFDVSANIRRPVALVMSAAVGVACSAIVDLARRDIQTFAGIKMRALGGELSGIDVQVAAALDAGGLRRGFAGGVLRGVVGEIDTTSGAVEAAGVVETAAGAGFIGRSAVAVLLGQQRDVFAGQGRVTVGGFNLGALEHQVAARRQLHVAAAEAGALLLDVVAGHGLLLVFVMHTGAVLAGVRGVFLGVGVEATGLGGFAAVAGVLRRMYVHIPRRINAQGAIGLDRRAGHFNVLGALELEVAVGGQLAAHRGAVLGVLPGFVLGDAEELAVLVVAVGVGGVLHAIDDQRTLVADNTGLSAAAHLATADAHVVSLDDQFAGSVDLAALVLGFALIGVAGLAEETATDQIARVAVVALALGAAGAGDFDLFAGEVDVALARQLRTFGTQQCRRGQGDISALQLTGDAALFFAAGVPVGFPQVFAVVALVGLGVAFGGGGQAQVAAALEVQIVCRIDFGRLEFGVATGGKLRVTAGKNLAAVLARVAVGLGPVVGFPGDADGAVVPVFASLLELAAFDGGQGQVAFGVEFDVAATHVGSGQGQVFAAVQADITLVAAHAGTGDVEAVGNGLTADAQVASGTNLHAIAARHLHRANPHARAFGSADDVDAPSLHRAEQAGIDALVGGVARRIDGFHLAAGVVHLIAADREVQLIPRTEAALAIDTRCDQVDRAFAVLQARALNLQAALGVTGAQGLQLAVVQFGATDH